MPEWSPLSSPLPSSGLGDDARGGHHHGSLIVRASIGVDREELIDISEQIGKAYPDRSKAALRIRLDMLAEQLPAHEARHVGKSRAYLLS